MSNSTSSGLDVLNSPQVAMPKLTTGPTASLVFATPTYRRSASSSGPGRKPIRGLFSCSSNTLTSEISSWPGNGEAMPKLAPVFTGVPARVSVCEPVLPPLAMFSDVSTVVMSETGRAVA